jgi:hypoxanthine-guanine phosphoribosyltransferase
MPSARSVQVQLDMPGMPNTELHLVGFGLDNGEWGTNPPNVIYPCITRN